MALPSSLQAQSAMSFGANLERFEYPWPVQEFPVMVGTAEGQMSFMDVVPDNPNGQVAVLLHGKNFCGATWEQTAQALLSAGYRVLIPDQIGFCKSSKPRDAQYTFAMMANFTRQLMEARQIDNAIFIGHSTGGMLAMHFAVMYPNNVSRLVLINPLGLTDRAAEGAAYVPLNELIAQERAKDRASIRQYQLSTYYHGQWDARYDRWVDMLAGQYASEDGESVTIAQAKTSEMILTQPVSQHFEKLVMPVTLMIGMLDTTTFGKGQAPTEVRDNMKPIPEVAPGAAHRMPRVKLLTFPRYGHSPQVEAPQDFNRALLDELRGVD